MHSDVQIFIYMTSSIFSCAGTLRTSLRGLPEDVGGGVRGLRNLAPEDASRSSRAAMDSSRGGMDSSRGIDSSRGGMDSSRGLDSRGVMDASRALLDSSRGLLEASSRGVGVMDPSRGVGVDPRVETGRLDQNYMMVRAQSRLQDGYDRLSHRH
jgi:hypothetical protein